MRKSRVRAINTRYKNRLFRSRLEARYAVYFDHLNIRWEYEPEGFELGNGLRYLPDFWLPDWGLWVEIKPTAPDAAGIEKARRLAYADAAVLLLVGPPRASLCRDNMFFGWDDRDSGSGFVSAVPAGFFAHFKGSPRLEIYKAYDRDYYPRENINGAVKALPTFDDDYPVDWKHAEKAVEAALSARFEFGAKGAV